MAVLRLAADGERVLLAECGSAPVGPELTAEHAWRAAPRLGRDAPIVILLHGFKFDPFLDAPCNPQGFLYHFEPEKALADPWRRSVSWPRGLGFADESDPGAEGLCVAFGWRARGVSTEQGTRAPYRFSLAFQEALTAGAALGEAVRCLAAAFPGHPVDIVAHSLGARVALAAVEALGAEHAALLGRLILMNPAEFDTAARRAMLAAGGAAPEVYAFGARENGVFDRLIARIAPWDLREGPVRRAPVGLRGLGETHARWIDLRIDDPELQDLGARSGVPLSVERRIACHWGVYNRPGIMELYAAILRERDDWSVAALQAQLTPPSPEIAEVEAAAM